MVEDVNGIAYVHLGYIKPRPNHRVKPWSEQGVLERPLSLNVMNLATLPVPTKEIALVNHNNYDINELMDFANKFNGDYATERRIVNVVADDRYLQGIRCMLLN